MWIRGKPNPVSGANSAGVLSTSLHNILGLVSFQSIRAMPWCLCFWKWGWCEWNQIWEKYYDLSDFILQVTVYNGSKEKEKYFVSKPSVHALEFLKQAHFLLVTEIATTCFSQCVYISLASELLNLKVINYQCECGELPLPTCAHRHTELVENSRRKSNAQLLVLQSRSVHCHWFFIIIKHMNLSLVMFYQ